MVCMYRYRPCLCTGLDLNFKTSTPSALLVTLWQPPLWTAMQASSSIYSQNVHCSQCNCTWQFHLWLVKPHPIWEDCRCLLIQEISSKLQIWDEQSVKDTGLAIQKQMRRKHVFSPPENSSILNFCRVHWWLILMFAMCQREERHELHWRCLAWRVQSKLWDGFHWARRHNSSGRKKPNYLQNTMINYASLCRHTTTWLLSTTSSDCVCHVALMSSIIPWFTELQGSRMDVQLDKHHWLQQNNYVGYF